MEMKRMSGGSLRAAGYDEREQTLRVELTAGNVRVQGRVARSVAAPLDASSPWSYFRDNIEEEFAAKRVR